MKREPIRMCIACRKRESQKLLIRLQIKEKRLVPFSGSGRSIYICRYCSTDNAKITQLSKRFKTDKTALTVMLKELTRNE